MKAFIENDGALVGLYDLIVRPSFMFRHKSIVVIQG